MRPEQAGSGFVTKPLQAEETISSTYSNPKERSTGGKFDLLINPAHNHAPEVASARKTLTKPTQDGVVNCENFYHCPVAVSWYQCLCIP